MDQRFKQLVIAGSIGAVLVGLILVAILAWRARFAFPSPESGNAPPPTATSATGTSTTRAGTGGKGETTPPPSGVSGVKNATPDFTKGKDRDGDGLTDAAETVYRTDPDKKDTDGDGYSDGDEVLKYGSDPKNKASTPATIEGHEKFNL